MNRSAVGAVQIRFRGRTQSATNQQFTSEWDNLLLLRMTTSHQSKGDPHTAARCLIHHLYRLRNLFYVSHDFLFLHHLLPFASLFYFVSEFLFSFFSSLSNVRCVETTLLCRLFKSILFQSFQHDTITLFMTRIMNTRSLFLTKRKSSDSIRGELRIETRGQTLSSLRRPNSFPLIPPYSVSHWTHNPTCFDCEQAKKRPVLLVLPTRRHESRSVDDVFFLHDRLLLPFLRKIESCRFEVG